MLRRAEPMRGAAAHEAGHAVVAYALGFPVSHVKIMPSPQTGGWEGETQVDFPDGTEASLRAAYFLGGPAAEDILDGTLADYGRQGYVGAFHDVLCAHYSLGVYLEGPESSDDFNESVKLLRAAYDEALAAILDHSTLWERAMQVLIAQHLIDVAFWRSPFAEG